MIQAGQCLQCGCTDERACPGGCIWANVTATLCSRCAQGREAAPAVAAEHMGGWYEGDSYASVTPEQLAGMYPLGDDEGVSLIDGGGLL